MTLNDSWGYHIADDGWKTPKQVFRNVITCAHDGGNYLLNIGPTADGSIPLESVQILALWALDGQERRVDSRSRPSASRAALASPPSRKGHTLFMHVHYWPGDTVALGSLLNKVNSASLLANGQRVAFRQDTYRVRFTGLPARAPDDTDHHARHRVRRRAEAGRTVRPPPRARTGLAYGIRL